MMHMFIGWLFIFFHVKINGFDLLPNFIGYALIFIGLTRLAGKSLNFEKAKPWAMGMSIVTFPVCIGQFFGFNFGNPVFRVVNLLSVLVRLYILYLINLGVREMEQKQNIDLGSEMLLRIWKIQVVVNILCTGLSLIHIKIVVLIVSLLAVIGVVTNAVFLVYFYRTAKISRNMSSTMISG